MEKVCYKCGESKSLSEFPKRKDSKDGYRNECKICQKLRIKKWKQDNKYDFKLYFHKNKKRIQNNNKLWREKNKEKIKQQQKKYREKNREELYRKKKIYRKNNKEKISKRTRKYYDREKNGVIAVYREKNKEKILKRIGEYVKLQRKLNTDQAVVSRLRDRISDFYKSTSIKKNKKSEYLVGCDWKTAIEYLDSLGYERGYHHLDHIVPLSLFDIHNEDHKRVMFHYTNLQPLSPEENHIKKNNLYPGWENTIKKISDTMGINPEPIINHLKKIY